MKRPSLKRLAVLAIATTAFLAVGTAVAFAVWTVPPSRAQVGAKAGEMPDGNRPGVKAVDGSVVVRWLAAGDASASGSLRYRVSRYAQDGTKQQALKSCGDTVVGLTCTEAGVPVGTWRYTVQPVLGQWTGDESGKSEPVTITAEDRKKNPVDLTPSSGATETPAAALPSTEPSTIASPAPSESVVVASPSASASPVPAPVKATGVQASNGRTAGVLDSGDKIVFRFDGAVDPGSLAEGWDGAGGRGLSVHLDKAELTIAGASSLGTVTLASGGYAATAVSLGATMTIAGNKVTVTVDESQATAPAAVTEGGAMKWKPGAVHALGGAVIANEGATITEAGGDVDF
jgi:hypothetical protein